MAFVPATVLPSGMLNASVWSDVSFTGFYLHDKTNITAGPLAGNCKLMCNGTYDLTQASTLKGNTYTSLVLIPANATMPQVCSQTPSTQGLI